MTAALAAAPALAGTIVHPTGSYPADVENVQAAVDAGEIRGFQSRQI
jgi:hypothetical protein